MVFYESQKCLSKNLKTVEINEGPTSSFYCIISRNFNEHGTIYKIEIRTGILTIYVGNNSDVIIDYPNKKDNMEPYILIISLTKKYQYL